MMIVEKVVNVKWLVGEGNYLKLCRKGIFGLHISTFRVQKIICIIVISMGDILKFSAWYFKIKFVTDTAHATSQHCPHLLLLNVPTFKGQNVDLMMSVEKMVDVFVSGFQGTKDNLYYSKSPTLVISMGDILTFSAYAFANKSQNQPHLLLNSAFKGQNVNRMMIVDLVIVSRRGNYLNFY